MAKLTSAQQEARYDAQRDGSAYIKPELSPLEEQILNLLLEISPPDPDELATTYAARFKVGFRVGQAIAHALIAEEQGEDIDTIIKQLEAAGL